MKSGIKREKNKGILIDTKHSNEKNNGGARGETFIAVTRGHGKLSSKPEQDCLHFP